MRMCYHAHLCTSSRYAGLGIILSTSLEEEKKSIVLVLEKTRNVKGRIFFFVRKKWGENSIPTQSIKARVSKTFSIFSLFLF
jgi:hypothetical protein